MYEFFFLVTFKCSSFWNTCCDKNKFHKIMAFGNGILISFNMFVCVSLKMT